MQRLRIEFDNLGCAQAYLKAFVKSEAAKEVVHFVLVFAGTETKDSLDFLETGLRVLLEQAIFCVATILICADRRHVCNWFLRDASEQVHRLV